jgi:hypothetical protein
VRRQRALRRGPAGGVSLAVGRALAGGARNLRYPCGYTGAGRDAFLAICGALSMDSPSLPKLEVAGSRPVRRLKNRLEIGRFSVRRTRLCPGRAGASAARNSVGVSGMAASCSGRLCPAKAVPGSRSPDRSRRASAPVVIGRLTGRSVLGAGRPGSPFRQRPWAPVAPVGIARNTGGWGVERHGVSD